MFYEYNYIAQKFKRKKYPLKINYCSWNFNIDEWNPVFRDDLIECQKVYKVKSEVWSKSLLSFIE